MELTVKIAIIVLAVIGIISTATSVGKRPIDGTTLTQIRAGLTLVGVIIWTVAIGAFVLWPAETIPEIIGKTYVIAAMTLPWVVDVPRIEKSSQRIRTVATAVPNIIINIAIIGCVLVLW